MWMRTVLLSAVMFFPVVAFADQTFRNPEYGYTLTLPNAWEQLPEPVVAPFRKLHGHKENATHPMVAFYQLVGHRRFFSPLILVNVGEYAEPMYLSRYDFRELTRYARKRRFEQSRHFDIHGTPFIRVDAFPGKRLIREVFDISDYERVALYTYFASDRYWEFVFVFPVDSPRSYAVREALDNIVLEREEMPGFEVLLRDTYERVKSEYRVFFEYMPSLRLVMAGGAAVVLLLILGGVYRWRERVKKARKAKKASGGQRG